MSKSFYYSVVSLFVLSVPAAAQEAIHFASLAGRITDATGAVVEGAAVTARQTETNLATTTTSDREGRFRFAYLRIGDYRVTVSHRGFADSARSLTLGAGAAVDLPVTLFIGATETNVTVTGETAALETSRSQLSGTVPRTELASLPLNGRSFLDLALLLPGVSPTNTASTQLFPETSAVPGQGISIAGQRNFSNSYIVDGLSANDDAAGLSGVFYGLDTVDELQVVASGGQAEFGRALGGYVSVVTRSGTNAVHGDLYGYFRNQRLNAANALSGTRLPLTQAQYGASAGGPVAKDRTFYFANLERRSLNQSGLVTIAPANVAAIDARLASAGYQGPPIATGQYPNPVHNTNALAKLDHQFSQRDMFTLRYSLYDVHSRNSRGAGALSAVTAAAGLDNTDHSIALGNVLALSPRLVNEARGQFTHSVLSAMPNDLTGPAVSISGVASFGRLSGSPTGRTNNLYELVDSLSYRTGAHTFRAGADYLYNGTTIAFPRSIRGSYSFSSLANFLAGTYNNSGFTQTFGNTVVPQGNPNAGFYAQDEWKPASRLTLNLGLRYDLEFLRTIATDTNNVSPRLGLAWTPGASRRTVVRAGAGVFYDRIPLRAVANALLSSGNTTTISPDSQISVSLSPTQTGAPHFPDVIGALPAGVLVSFTTMNRQMQNAGSVQTSVEVERQVGARGTLSAGYQHLRGLHLILSVNQNVPACAPSGSNNGCRPNPAYANNNQYSPLGDSRYDGWYVSFVQRPVRWGDYRISYTYSKAMDDVGEFFFSAPIDNFNVWRDWGRSDDDQRHRLVFRGAAHLLYGIELSTVLQYYSALPFNITSGANTIQGTTARPLLNGAFIPRNAGTGFDLLNLNARLSRTFHVRDTLKVQAIAEAFNGLNRANGVTLNPTFGGGSYPSSPLPAFRQVTAEADPRSLQLALRLSF